MDWFYMSAVIDIRNGSKRILLTTGKPIIKFDQVIGYRGAYKDISEIKAQEASIRKLAYFDPLTNLAKSYFV